MEKNELVRYGQVTTSSIEIRLKAKAISPQRLTLHREHRVKQHPEHLKSPLVGGPFRARRKLKTSDTHHRGLRCSETQSEHVPETSIPRVRRHFRAEAES